MSLLCCLGSSNWSGIKALFMMYQGTLWLQGLAVWAWGMGVGDAYVGLLTQGKRGALVDDC